MGGGSYGGGMRSSGSYGGARSAPSPYSRATAPRSSYMAARPSVAPRSNYAPRTALAPRTATAARPGYSSAPNRFATPTRPTYNAAGRVGANTSALRGSGPVNQRDRGFGDRRFRGYGYGGYGYGGYGYGYPGYGPVLFWGSPYYFDSYNDCYYDPNYCYDYDDYYDPGYAPQAQYPDQPDQQQGDQDLYAAPPNGAPAYGQGGAIDNTSPTRMGNGSDDFVLVRKDGGLLFASGYVIRNGQMTYIDDNGVFRKVMIADLDVAATRKWNDDRGNPVNIPN